MSSLMDTLPVELLSSIFEWISRESDDPCRVLPLSCTSHRLRDVFLSTPSLWTNVTFNKRLPIHWGCDALQRSRARPIDVSLNTLGVTDKEASTTISEVVKHTSRWRAFRLDASTVNSEALGQIILNALRGAIDGSKLPSMNTLDIVGPLLPASEADRSLGAMNATSLHYLSLRRVGLDFGRSLLPALKDLHLAGIEGPSAPTTAAFLNFISSCPKLRSLHVERLLVLEDDVEAFQSTPSLPDLTSISIHDSSLQLAYHLLVSASHPNLTDLTIAAHEAPESLDWTRLTHDGLTRVKSFTWATTRPPPSELDALRLSAFLGAVLQSVSGARRVVLSGSNALHQLVSSSHTVVPAMTELHVRDVKGYSLGAIDDLLHRRRDAGAAGLKRLSISATDFSMTASAGRRCLEEIDASLDRLRETVGLVDIRERQDGNAFRYTFLGWRDYQMHETSGRDYEYMQEYEE